jgi:hypothetical protein
MVQSMTDIPETDPGYTQFKIGQDLGGASFLLDAERVRQYRLLFGNTGPVKEGDTVPPFMLAMLCHRFLAEQPKRRSGSIHVRQRSSFLGLAPVGAVFVVRGRVAEMWEKKGRTWILFQLEGFLENGPVVYRCQTTSILGG